MEFRSIARLVQTPGKRGEGKRRRWLRRKQSQGGGRLGRGPERVFYAEGRERLRALDVL